MKTKMKSGQVALLTVIFFLLISLVVLGAFAALGISQLNSSADLLRSKKSMVIAESGNEDAYHRVLTEKQPQAPAEVSVKINSGNAQVTIAKDISTGIYSIVSRGSILGGDNIGRYRNVSSKFKIISAKGFGFESALQAGFLGIEMNDTASLLHINEPTEHGNVFSNGSIKGTNGVYDYITGNITVASSTADDINYAEQSLLNESAPFDATATKQIKLGDSLQRTYIAQSFIAPVTAPVTKIDFYIKTQGNPGTFSVRIMRNRYTSPLDRPETSLSNNISQKAFTADEIPVDFSDWQRVRLIVGSGPQVAVENNKYWILFYCDTSGGSPPCNSSNYYILGESPSDTSYTTGRDINNKKNNCYGEIWCNWGTDFGVGDGNATVKCSSDNTNVGILYYAWDNAACATGSSKKDIAFNVYFGDPETIDGTPSTHYTTVVDGINSGPGFEPGYSGTYGFIKADKIKNSYISPVQNTGDAYYHYIEPIVIASGDTCTTSGGGPHCKNGVNYIPDPPLPLFISGSDFWQKIINDYKTIAYGGTTYSFPTPINTSVSIGPGVVNGDLAISGGGNVTITGNNNDKVIWVTGKVNFYGTNCTIRVTDMNQSAYIIVNGSSMSLFQGRCKFVVPKGSTGDIFIINPYSNPTVSNWPDILLSIRDYVNIQADIDPPNCSMPGGGDCEMSGVFFTPLGKLQLLNQSTVAAATAARISFNNGANVRYKSGIKDVQCPGTCQSITNVTKFSEYHEIE